MAYGNNTQANISSYVNTIFAGAMLVARDNVLAPAIVNVMNDKKGMAARVNSVYGTATINTLGEADDLTSQVFTPAGVGTLTPAESGAQFLLTDQRIETDPFQVQRDAAQELGAAIAQKIDSNVFSNFSSLTGGTVGASGSAISWTYFFNAIALLDAQNAPKPYVAVLHPYQWVILGAAVSLAGSANNASEGVKSEADRMYYVQTVGGVRIYVHSGVQTSGTDAYMGMFSRQALGLDFRRAPRIEPERDASRRAWELNLSTVYAHGIWRPKFGVQGLFALTTPS